MKITILTLFPAMIEPFFSSSIMKRAVERKIVEYEIIDIRSFAEGKHKKADDIPYGGGAGMLMMAPPLFKALDSVGAKGKRVIFPTPSGKIFNQEYATDIAKENELIFICGHYEGIDERVIDTYVTDEISIGDYVLSSGESAALVIIDAFFRLIKGVIAEESLSDESFPLLEYPQYTRPLRYCKKCVPVVLSSGHHKEIEKWRLEERLKKTLRNRSDLLSNVSLSIDEREALLRVLKKEKMKWTLSEL